MSSLIAAISPAVRTLTLVGTRSRSTRWLRVRMRGVTRQRAPPVPAVPQQSSASASRAAWSTASRSAPSAARRMRISAGSGPWCARHSAPSSLSCTEAMPIRSARARTGSPRRRSRSSSTSAVALARASAFGPATETSPSPSQEPSKLAVTFRVSGAGCPRRPRTATRSGPSCSREQPEMSSTTSGVM